MPVSREGEEQGDKIVVRRAGPIPPEAFGRAIVSFIISPARRTHHENNYAL